MSGKMDKLKGEIKEGWGKVTGDRSTQAEGKFDQAKGGVKDAASDVRDSVRDTVRDAKHDERHAVHREP